MATAYRSQAGRDAEVQLINELEDAGWVCGSRRHIPGPGDILAVLQLQGLDGQGDGYDIRLIEVKTTARGPYKKMGPTERQALRDAAARIGATPWIAWRPYPSEPWRWLHEGLWPS